MTKQQTDIEEQPENTLGDLLRKTRHAKGTTLADAAGTTRINGKFLRALEKDDFEKLPDEIFIRGFIRLYATYLGLDPEDTFRHYILQEKLDPNKPAAKPYRDEIINDELLDRTSIFIKKSRKVLPVTILLSILILFYVLGIFFKDDNLSPSLEPVSNITNSQADNPPVEDLEKSITPVSQKPLVKSPQQAKQEVNKTKTIATAKVSSPQVEKKETQQTIKTPAIKTIEPVKVTMPVTRSEAVAPVTLPITVKVATETVPLPPKTNTTDVDFKYILEARFEENSGVSIKVDDKPQLKYNSQAGIVRIWKANEKIALTLDNGADVFLTLNGKPITIVDTEGSTATLNIPADLPESNQP